MTSACEKCLYVDYCEHCNSAGVFIVGCSKYAEKKPQTNGDNIRKYSNEQLARLLNHIETDGAAFGPRGFSQWLAWLEQEAQL